MKCPRGPRRLCPNRPSRNPCQGTSPRAPTSRGPELLSTHAHSEQQGLSTPAKHEVSDCLTPDVCPSDSVSGGMAVPLFLLKEKGPGKLMNPPSSRGGEGCRFLYLPVVSPSLGKDTDLELRSSSGEDTNSVSPVPGI